MAEFIEFMRRTDNRHLQTHIRFKIKEVFQERNNDLANRQQRLKTMLAAEELQQEEELANLFRARVFANVQKRLDWISTAKFERTEAETEFLKLKQIQRELINCEEMRPMESKKITEDTKRIQLIQIAEKKALQMKEKEIDKIWFEATMCLEREKEKQQQYEEHLKKIIANQSVNLLDSQLEHLKQIKELENEEKREENLRIERSDHAEALIFDFETRQKLNNKIKEGTKQKNELQAIENENQLKIRQTRFSEAVNNEIQNIQLKQEENVRKFNRDLEKRSHTEYLQHVKDKKSEMNCRNKMLDTALVAYGRRMQPEPIAKTPYQKSIR